MKVTFSTLASYKLEKLIEQIRLNWGDKTAQDVLILIDDRVTQISKFPESCPVSVIDGKIRKCVVSKQRSLYYEISNNEIQVLTVVDNRQNSKDIFEDIQKHFR